MLSSSRFGDTPLGFTLIRTLMSHRQRVRWLAWSPDGQTIASGSDDHTIKLWNVKTGSAQTLVGHSGNVYSVAWSPDGRLLASGSADKTICVWDAHTCEQRKVLHGHSDTVYSVAWSPNGLLASSARDRTIRIWEPTTWQQRHILIGHNGPVYSVAWAWDGQMLASGSSDYSIRLWNGSTGRPQQELKVHFGAVCSVAWSRDGLLASGSADRTIRLWDPKKGTATRVLEGHTDVICSVAFSSDGHLLASLGHDGTVQLWNRATSELIGSLQEEIDETMPVWLVEPLKNLAFHPSAYNLATLCANDRGIKLWSLNFGIPGATKSAKTIHYANAKSAGRIPVRRAGVDDLRHACGTPDQLAGVQEACTL